jgi:uncharacterized protein (TIGR02145 family)
MISFRFTIPSFLLTISSMMLLTCCAGNSVCYHGHTYPVIREGNRYWMAENLSTYKYRFGKQIKKVTNDSIWAALDLPACTAYDNSDSIAGIYGLLYNWRAVETGRLCPVGWHVATDQDWLDLEKELGGGKRAGGRLKSVGFWKTRMPAGDDIFFRALPAGYKRDHSFGLGYSAIWWTSTRVDSSYCWGRRIESLSENITSTLNEKENGFSVRCVKKARR